MKLIHSRPRRARADRGLPVQRGGWVTPSVRKPFGDDMLRWLQRRRHRGGWIGVGIPPGYNARRPIKRYKKHKKRRTTRGR